MQYLRHNSELMENNTPTNDLNSAFISIFAGRKNVNFIYKTLKYESKCQIYWL